MGENDDKTEAFKKKADEYGLLIQSSEGMFYAKAKPKAMFLRH